MMNFNNLKTKFGICYFVLSSIICGLIVISVVQFMSFERQEKYIVEDIAYALKLASDVKSHIFSLRTDVEKFIYKSIETDKIKAEKSIKKINKLMELDFTPMMLFCPEKDILLIQKKIRTYIENFSNTSIRLSAIQHNAERLQKDSFEITSTFKMLIVDTKNSRLSNSIITHAFTQFVNAISDVQNYFYYHNEDDAQMVLSKLLVIINQLSSCKKCEDIHFLIDDYRDNFEGFVDVRQKMDEEINKTLLPLAPEIVKMAVHITNKGWSEMEHSKYRIKNEAEKTRKVIVLFGMMAIILGLIMAIFLSGQIFKPVNKLVAYATQVSEGDLSADIDMNASDEMRKLSDAIRTMVNNFKTIVSDIIQKSNQLAEASEALVGISASMSENACEMQTQSEDVANTSIHMTTNISAIASSIHQMNSNVKDVATSSEEMNSDIQSIKNAIKTLSHSMSSIDEKAVKGADTAGRAKKFASDARKIINQLGLSAENIGDITKMMMHIADKTNLLALNAAIEAAAAGEYGRGFGVVANAIQQFSDQSNQAAEDIATSIWDVQDKIHLAIQSISDVYGIMEELFGFTEEVQNDVDGQLKITEQIFSDISSAMNKTENVTTSMKDLSKGINVVSLNTNDAADGVNKVSDKINNVSNVSKNSASIVNHVRTETTELSRMSEKLMALVNHFKVDN
jgi:methyl-accepting chemotaxis protein